MRQEAVGMGRLILRRVRKKTQRVVESFARELARSPNLGFGEAGGRCRFLIFSDFCPLAYTIPKAKRGKKRLGAAGNADNLRTKLYKCIDVTLP